MWGKRQKQRAVGRAEGKRERGGEQTVSSRSLGTRGLRAEGWAAAWNIATSSRRLERLLTRPLARLGGGRQTMLLRVLLRSRWLK